MASSSSVIFSMLFVPQKLHCLYTLLIKYRNFHYSLSYYQYLLIGRQIYDSKSISSKANWSKSSCLFSCQLLGWMHQKFQQSTSETHNHFSIGELMYSDWCSTNKKINWVRKQIYKEEGIKKRNGEEKESMKRNFATSYQKFIHSSINENYIAK